MATRHDPSDQGDLGDTPTRAENVPASSETDAKTTAEPTATRGTADRTTADGTTTDRTTGAGTTAAGTTAATAAPAAARTGDTPEATRREKIQGTRGTVQTREQRLEEEANEHRRESAYQLARARTSNRTSTDFGLLLLRVLPVIMFLHGLRKASNFSGFRDTVAGNSFGALAPDVFAIMVVAGQLILPILIAIGLLTRLSALLMAVMMAFVWVLTQLPNGLIDARTGGIVGEAAIMFVIVSLPLIFTGPGRFSLDHALTAKRAEARAQRRADKAVA